MQFVLPLVRAHQQELILSCLPRIKVRLTLLAGTEIVNITDLNGSLRLSDDFFRVPVLINLQIANIEVLLDYILSHLFARVMLPDYRKEMKIAPAHLQRLPFA